MRTIRPQVTGSRRGRESGFALVTVAFSLVSLVGTVGLGVDIGRMYIAKSEAQAYADAAALAAALELDGSVDGLDRARRAVTARPGRQNLSDVPFAAPEVEFAMAAEGPFSAIPKTAAGVRFVRVMAAAPVAIYFLRVTGAPANSTARASAVGGQVEKTSFREGLFPFAVAAERGALTAGERYALRYIESEGAGDVRRAVLSDAQTRAVGLGDTVVATSPKGDLVKEAMAERIGMDSDAAAPDYAAYRGNGRRLAAVAVLGAGGRVEGFAAVLLPAAFEEPVTAELVGPWVQGSDTRGAAEGQVGAYVVRLVQ